MWLILSVQHCPLLSYPQFQCDSQLTQPHAAVTALPPNETAYADATCFSSPVDPLRKDLFVSLQLATARISAAIFIVAKFEKVSDTA
jgi:hypothetical protein